jgi:hypothetical protein
MTGTSGPATLGLEGRLGYTITVPESWFELDVHPATRDDSIKRLVEDRVRGNQPMWDARKGIIKLLREQARVAHNAGATYCASFAIPTDEGPVTGSVVVSLVRGPAGATREEDDRGEHLASLYTPVPRGKGEFDPYTMVSSVEIPTCGHCARSWGIADLDVEGGPAAGGAVIRNVFMQTAIPVPGFNKVFLISASSPVVALADDLFDLFDAVAGTFRLVPLTGGENEDGKAY